MEKQTLREYIVVVQSLSRVQLFVTPWTEALQGSLSFTISWSLLTLVSSEWVMPFNHLVLCHPRLLLPSFSPRIRVFSDESALHIRWTKYWRFSINSSSEYSGLISFRVDWFNLLAVQGTLKSLLQTTVQKYQFFGTQLSLWSSSHIHIEKTIALFPDGLLSAK